MNEQTEKPQRSPLPGAVRTVIIVGVMAIGVWWAGEQLRPRPEARTGHDGGVLAAVRAGSGLERPVTFATRLDLTERTDVSPRDLKTYYQRRAYPGSPPMIPHEVESDFDSAKDCNACHERGGFVERFNAYTPLSPHPEYENCLQCHVRGDGPATLFEPTGWQRPTPPKLGRSALGGGPPPIPHTLQLRENCLACHAGPAAPPEIRTPHPERVSCQQCHVPVGTAPGFVRTERP